MERFREHEKEFKMKQYSKWALRADYEKQGNYVDNHAGETGNYSDSYGSNSDENSNSDNSNSDEKDDEYGIEDIDDEEDADDSQLLERDKEWLDSFIHDKLKKSITKVE